MRGRRKDEQRGQQPYPAAQPPQGVAQPLYAATGQPISLPAHTAPTTYSFSEPAKLSTLPMPYDVAAVHQGLYVYATAFGPGGAGLGEVFQKAAESLSAEAARRGCAAVYGVQHSHTERADGIVSVIMSGTGAHPLTDLDTRPAYPGD